MEFANELFRQLNDKLLDNNIDNKLNNRHKYYMNHKRDDKFKIDDKVFAFIRQLIEEQLEKQNNNNNEDNRLYSELSGPKVLTLYCLNSFLILI